MKTCVSCKWYHFEKMNIHSDRCLNPLTSLPSMTERRYAHLIGREPEVKHPNQWCVLARQEQCGEEGNLWEPKAPEVSVGLTDPDEEHATADASA